MIRSVLILLGALGVIGLALWSLSFNSRYQAMCEISWWTASKQEIQRCDDRMTELHGR